MPHIHTQPDQHDMTVSAWIIRKVKDDWQCLVHFHKKIEKFMQIGGHIELNETPWQSLVHEIEEESGYKLNQLKILQHSSDQLNTSLYVVHPEPFSLNTHNVNNQHYHSDLCYGFLVDDLPSASPAKGESTNLKWMNLKQLKQSSNSGDTLKDVYPIYKFLIDHFDSYALINADSYSLEKPDVPSSTYKIGKPGF